jgi:hypothetical protein
VQQAFVLGAIGKMIATVITFPLILAKTRLQAASKQKASDSAQVSISLHYICTLR